MSSLESNLRNFWRRSFKWWHCNILLGKPQPKIELCGFILSWNAGKIIRISIGTGDLQFKTTYSNRPKSEHSKSGNRLNWDVWNVPISDKRLAHLGLPIWALRAINFVHLKWSRLVFKFRFWTVSGNGTKVEHLKTKLALILDIYCRVSVQNPNLSGFQTLIPSGFQMFGFSDTWNLV